MQPGRKLKLTEDTLGTNLCRIKSSVCLLDGNPVIHPRILPGDELSDVVRKKYGVIDYEYGISGASTDFVSVLV